jgi:transcriptional regulator GlxA family with amidase domain
LTHIWPIGHSAIGLVCGMTKRRRVLMLAFPDCQLLDVTGPMATFAGVNEVLGRQVYELVILAPKRGPLRTFSGISIVSDAAIDDFAPTTLRKSDTVIAPGGSPGVGRALDAGQIVEFLKQADQRGVRIASVCSGTLLLAAAGVLDGRRATTHWNAVERLRHLRPQVKVDDESIYVRDGNVWTSAGVTAGIDLALAMIEADLGRETALAVARLYVVFRIRPGGQRQYSSELAAQAMRDDRLSRLAERIAQRPEQDWRTPALAIEAGMSVRSLSRLFRKELNVSPAEFVERVRIDRARRDLLDTNAPIKRVASRCGFVTRRRMDRAFARTISATPTEFRARFQSPGAGT